MHYRNYITGGFSVFNLRYKYSDLLIGVKSKGKNNEELKTIIIPELEAMYSVLEEFINENPEFKTTHSPLNIASHTDFIEKMILYSKEADVGPMAAVAGAFASNLSKTLDNYTHEVFIENGGDITLHNKKNVRVSIYPGWSCFESDVFLIVPPGNHGIASSSGRFGHSFSMGKADIVTVVSQDAAKSDAFATAIGNQIKPGCDPEQILEKYKELRSITIIWQGKIWHRGNIELDF